MNMSNTLKSYPFCGESTDSKIDREGLWIECKRCLFCFNIKPFLGQEEATEEELIETLIFQWNQRARV